MLECEIAGLMCLDRLLASLVFSEPLQKEVFSVFLNPEPMENMGSKNLRDGEYEKWIKFAAFFCPGSKMTFCAIA